MIIFKKTNKRNGMTMNNGEIINKIEDLLEKDCFVIDFLPRRVPENSGGCFFSFFFVTCETTASSGVFPPSSSMSFSAVCRPKRRFRSTSFRQIKRRSLKRATITPMSLCR